MARKQGIDDVSGGFINNLQWQAGRIGTFALQEVPRVSEDLQSWNRQIPSRGEAANYVSTQLFGNLERVNVPQTPPSDTYVWGDPQGGIGNPIGYNVAVQKMAATPYAPNPARVQMASLTGPSFAARMDSFLRSIGLRR